VGPKRLSIAATQSRPYRRAQDRLSILLPELDQYPPMARDLAPDWILQETLAIQAQTAQWFKDKQAEHAGQKPLTLTVLGCGMRQQHHY
jgi:hypothetical protein